MHDKIKEIAKLFLYLPLKSELGGLFVNHPFTNSYAWYNQETKKLMNLQIPEVYNQWVEFMATLIDNTADIRQIVMLMNDNYSFAFLKHIRKYLTDKELGYCLARALMKSEGVYDSDIFTSSQLIKLILKADKSELMEESELDTFNSLESKLTVYRGVNGRDRKSGKVGVDFWKGLSWTSDYKTAEWFAKRFVLGENKVECVVYEAEIPRELVLAVFEGEDEVLVDVRKLSKDMIIRHVLD